MACVGVTEASARPTRVFDSIWSWICGARRRRSPNIATRRAVAATLIMDDPHDEEARFAIHLAQNMPEETTHPADPYDEESRFAIHLAMQKTPEEII